MLTYSNRLGSWALAGLCALAVAAPVHAQGEGRAETLEERLSRVEERLEKAKDDQLPWDPYVSEFGGRIQFDETFNMDADDRIEDVVGDGDLEDGAEFRRVRFYAEGDIESWLAYKLQLEFAGGVELRDVYLKAHDLGALPEIKIGNFKEPFSLQELTSSKYITLMSRSMLTDFFTPARRSGLQLSEHFAGDRLNVSAGVFNSDFDAEDGESATGTNGQYDFAARVTSPVLYTAGGRRLLHLGGSYLRRGADGEFGFGLEPEVHKTDDFVGGTLNGVDNTDTFGIEVAGVFGPAHLQGEYALMNVNRDSGEEPDIDGFYIQGGYFLTGEHRPYDKGDGSFGRVKPRRPFTDLGSAAGAWEIAARYSQIDFSELQNLGTGDFVPAFGTIQQAASKVDVITVGLNWYPSSHARWMLNYVSADQDALGDASYIATRFQVDF